jgi:cold shock CspA family protein
MNMRGSVKTFVTEKGYGFIVGDDGKDYFFRLEAFSNQSHKDALCDDSIVDFEPSANTKGYRAKNCSLINASDVHTFEIPREMPTSLSSTIKGWDVIESGDWIVHGSSRISPDEARHDLNYKARSVLANALIDVSYYKTTGSEAGTGQGIHHYTIHNFRARIAMVAKRSANGAYNKDDLGGMNQKAAAEKIRLSDLTQKNHSERNLGFGVIFAIIIGAAMIGHSESSTVGAFIAFLMLLAFAVLVPVTNHGDWLQPG